MINKSEPENNKKATTSWGQEVVNQTEPNFPIVGIGASAGGLEAFEHFFIAMPNVFGAAFVLVSHLAPNHVSMLPELIQKKTTMKVNLVVDNMKVVPNQVYIIPPNKELSILNGALKLVEIPISQKAHLPIDRFFCSLAQDIGNMAIGIILSGTGTDGSLGVRAIKTAGGMVMAQNIDSAEFDGMPRSSINTNLIDYILTPDKMPEQLFNYVKNMSLKHSNSSTTESDTIQRSLQKIFALLLSATGHDFSHYKQNTIFRRIERRMHVHQINTIKNYTHYLQESEHETSILFKELLIGVTSFFRDTEAFISLKKNIIPQLLKDKPVNSQFRIWVPGCSTGEEVYSIAIIMCECMKEMKLHYPILIFGTDLCEESIKTARAGIYSESVCTNISSTRLQEFFIKDNNHYKIKKHIREMIVFASQDIIKDPPFRKLDILSCRNLLIYFDKELQKKLLPTFHYSLEPGGILFLGSSESATQAVDLFLPLDKKWKIFKSQPSIRSTSPILHFPSNDSNNTLINKATPNKQRKFMNAMNPIKLMKTMIAQSDMSTCVVIDDHGRMLYIHGHTGAYLEPAEGEANLNILEMARPGLKIGLTNAIRQMAANRCEVIAKNLLIQGTQERVNLILKPLPNLQTGLNGLMLVIFEKISNTTSERIFKTIKSKSPRKNKELKKLEEELLYTKENLQTTIEELETSNELLKSANEELQSTNEELQSTNEELETSKEELQSVNREVGTVNSELQKKNDDLTIANDDMKDLLDTTEIATVYLDLNLNIRRFTAKATELIFLTAMDIGRPIMHIATRLKELNLAEYAQDILKDPRTKEVEVQNTAGTIYCMRLRPYHSINNDIDGVVIIFEDITRLRQLSQAKRLAAIVEKSKDAIILHDFKGNITAWNRGAERMYGYSETEALTMNFLDTIPSEKKDEIRQLFSNLKNDNDNLNSFIIERVRKDGTIVSVWATATLIRNEQNQLKHIATTERDLSIITQNELLKSARD